MQLESFVDSQVRLGLCYRGVPVLDGVEPHVCQKLRCLWSAEASANVDMWLNPMAELPAYALEGRCPEPRGGQRAAADTGTPRISFIVTMHNNVASTARCLLELFRTAHEVDSVECVVVDDGSTENTDEVVRLAAALRHYFGAAVLYLRNSEAQGYGEANTKGINAASGQYVALINNDM